MSNVKNYCVVHLKAMAREKLDHRMWDFKMDFPSQFMIKHRITGEYRIIPKQGLPWRGRN